MNKIGILGGTFNPIHNGHISLAIEAYKELCLDKVMFIPNGVSYMKSEISMPDKLIRYNMTKLGIEDYSEFIISDIEINREGNSYTYETLLQLKDNNPDDIYYFIIGADTLFNMESWMKPDVIFENSIIAAAVRDDMDIDDINNKIFDLQKKYKASVIPLHAPKIDISSSSLRKSILSGCDVSDLIPPKVYDYIKNNKLYYV